MANDDNNNGKNDDNSAQRFSNGTGGRCKACWLKLCIEKFKIDFDTRRSLMEKYCQKSTIESSEIIVDNKPVTTSKTSMLKKHKINVKNHNECQKPVLNKVQSTKKSETLNNVDSSMKKLKSMSNENDLQIEPQMLMKRKKIHKDSDENKQINSLKLQFSINKNEISSNNNVTMPLTMVDVQSSSEEIRFPYSINSSPNFIDHDSKYPIEQNTTIKTNVGSMKSAHFNHDESMMISTTEMFALNNDYQMTRRHEEHKQTKTNPLINMENSDEINNESTIHVEKSRWMKTKDKKKMKTAIDSMDRNSSEKFIISRGSYFQDNKTNHHNNQSTSSLLTNINNNNKKSRCKECEGCRAQDCGQCSYCLDKKKFGGSNVIKQACKYRICIRFRGSTRRQQQQKNNTNNNNNNIGSNSSSSSSLLTNHHHSSNESSSSQSSSSSSFMNSLECNNNNSNSTTQNILGEKIQQQSSFHNNGPNFFPTPSPSHSNGSPNSSIVPTSSSSSSSSSCSTTLVNSHCTSMTQSSSPQSLHYYLEKSNNLSKYLNPNFAMSTESVSRHNPHYHHHNHCHYHPYLDHHGSSYNNNTSYNSTTTNYPFYSSDTMTNCFNGMVLGTNDTLSSSYNHHHHHPPSSYDQISHSSDNSYNAQPTSDFLSSTNFANRSWYDGQSSYQPPSLQPSSSSSSSSTEFQQQLNSDTYDVRFKFLNFLN